MASTGHIKVSATISLGSVLGKFGSRHKKEIPDYTILIGFRGKYPRIRGNINGNTLRRNEDVSVASVARGLQEGSFGHNSRRYFSNGEKNRRVYVHEGAKGAPKLKRWTFIDDTVKRKKNTWFNDLASKNRTHGLSYILGLNRPGKKSKRIRMYEATKWLGDKIIKDIRSTIKKANAPSLEPDTVEKKRKLGVSDPSHPLIESGRMLDSIFMRIVEGKSYKTSSYFDISNYIPKARYKADSSAEFVEGEIIRGRTSRKTSRLSSYDSMDSSMPIKETGVIEELLGDF